MLQLAELLVMRASSNPIGLLVTTVLCLLIMLIMDFLHNYKQSIYRAKGDKIDSGRGLSSRRRALTGTPLALTFRGFMLNGVVFDNEAGVLLLRHLPSLLGACRYASSFKGEHLSYLRANFGDESLAKEVIKLTRPRVTREGDLSLAVVNEWDGERWNERVQFRIWGSSSFLSSIKVEVFVGRLDYASILNCQKIAHNSRNTPNDFSTVMTVSYGERDAGSSSSSRSVAEN